MATRFQELLVTIRGDDTDVARKLVATERRSVQVASRIEALNGRLARAASPSSGSAPVAGLAPAAAQATRAVERSSEAVQRLDRHMRSLGGAGREAAGGLREAERSARGGVGTLAAFTRSAAGAVGGLSLIGAVAGVGGAAMTYERLAEGIDTASSSAFAAERQLAILREVAKAPGIGFREALEGSIRLQSVEMGAQRSARALKEFANAVALSGRGRPELESVVGQLQQLITRPKVLMEDLKPIITQAPAVATAIKQAFGTISPEEINRQVGSTREFVDKLLDAMEKMPRAAATSSNALDNLKDAVYQLAIAAGSTALPEMKATFQGLASAAEYLAEHMEEVQRIVVIGAAALGGRYAAALLVAAAAKIQKMRASMAAAQAEVAETRVAIAAAQAQVARAAQNRAGAVAALQMARANTAVTGSYQLQGVAALELRAAETALSASKARLTALVNQETAALQRGTAATVAATGAKAAAGRLLAAFGGWTGLAVTALTTLGAYFLTTKSKVEQAKESLDDFRGSLLALSKTELRIKIAELETEQFEKSREAASTPKELAPPRTVGMRGGIIRTITTPNPRLKEVASELDAINSRLGLATNLLEELEALSDGPPPPPPLDPDLTDKAASAVQQLTDRMREFRALAALGLGVRGVDELPDGLKASFERAQQLQDKIVEINRELAELKDAGRAAPAGIGELLASLTAQLREAQAEVATAASGMRAARARWEAAGGPSGGFVGTSAVVSRPGGSPASFRASLVAGGVSAGTLGARRAVADADTARSRGAVDFSPTVLLETFERMDRQARELEAGWERLSQSFRRPGEALRLATQEIGRVGQDLASRFTPLALLGELLGGVMEGFRGPLEAIALPLSMVGQLLGGLIAPALHALFPPVKFVAIALSYLGTALGWLVRSIGKAVDSLPFVSGGPIIRAGQEMMDAAERTRKELAGLSWQDALQEVGERAEKVAEQMSNVPEGFRTFNAALARYAATAAPGRAAVASPTPVRAAGNTIQGDVNIIIPGAEKSARELTRLVVGEIKALLNNQGDPAGLRNALPAV